MLNMSIVRMRSQSALIVHSGQFKLSAQSGRLIVHFLLRVASTIKKEADHHQNQNDHRNHNGDNDAYFKVAHFCVLLIAFKTLPVFVTSVKKVSRSVPNLNFR